MNMLVHTRFCCFGTFFSNNFLNDPECPLLCIIKRTQNKWTKRTHINIVFLVMSPPIYTLLFFLILDCTLCLSLSLNFSLCFFFIFHSLIFYSFFILHHSISLFLLFIYSWIYLRPSIFTVQILSSFYLFNYFSISFILYYLFTLQFLLPFVHLFTPQILSSFLIFTINFILSFNYLFTSQFLSFLILS